MQQLTVYKDELKQYIHTDAEIELLDATCSFSEGPVWNSEGYYLFSDIPQNIINKLAPGKKKELFLSGSGCDHPDDAELPHMMGSNGLTYLNRELIICQHGNHAIAQYDGNGVTKMIAAYNGKAFNSPNDIIAHTDGSLFFSDPPYGLKDQKLNAEKYQPLAGFYCWRNGALTLFCDRYQYPNGVCLSPDGQSLFTCSNKPFENFVLEFDTKTLQAKREVCAENSDGIKCDQHHNLYLCSKEGIVIINAKGERLGVIELPAVPANCCWGGKDLRDLFICARENIFLIRNLQK